MAVSDRLFKKKCLLPPGVGNISFTFILKTQYCVLMLNFVHYSLQGHDYIHSDAQILKDTNQDWSVCGDGLVHVGAVKGAVDEFAEKKGLTIAVTYREPDWPSWMTVKPL